MEKHDYKRHIRMIDRDFQAKFILKFCALVALGGLFTVGILYLLALSSTTVSIVDSRVVVRTTADFLMPVLIQTILIVMILVGIATIFVTLFVSHKISGPLYRFKKVLEALEQGDFSDNFKIRDPDQLQGISTVFNAMITKVRAHLGALKDNLASLKEKLNNIAEHEIAEGKQAYLKELKRISEELNKILDYFKT